MPSMSSAPEPTVRPVPVLVRDLAEGQELDQVLLVRSVSAPETSVTTEDAAARQRDAERTPVASPA